MKKIYLVLLVLMTNYCYSQTTQTDPKKGNAITIGIGFITDSTSKISHQYSIYEFLLKNPIYDRDDNEVTPVLTLKRGVTQYYINGKMGKKGLEFNVWHDGKLVNQFTLAYDNDENNSQAKSQHDYNYLVESRLYYKLLEITSGKKMEAIAKPQNESEESTPDYSSKQKKMHYVDVMPYDEVKPLFEGPISSYLLPSGENSKFYNEILTKGPEEKTMKNYVNRQLIVPAIIAKKSRKADYPNGEIGIESNPLAVLNSINIYYSAINYDIDFFKSKYIDDKIKNEARRVIMPLWKSAGPVYLYNFCGRIFVADTQYNEAIECFNSGLLMANNVVTLGKTKEVLKYGLLANLDTVYAKNSQGASAYLCRNLAELHHEIYKSYYIYCLDDTIKNQTADIGEYLNMVENNAKKAKKNAHLATFQAVTSSVGTLSSAAQDGLSGKTTPSSGTQQLGQQSVGFLNQHSDMKRASLDATKIAGQVFSSAFGEIEEEFNRDNGIDQNQPLLSFEFVQILANKDLALEKQGSILRFANNIPSIKSEVNLYFKDIEDPIASASDLKDVYTKFKALEIKIFKEEARGKLTDEHLVTN